MSCKPPLVFLALLLSFPVCHIATAATVDTDIQLAMTRLRLSEIRKMPSVPVYGSADSAYWRVVRKGYSAVPDLATLVADATPTGIPVVFHGGEYCIGDIAVMALQEIIHDLPIAALVVKVSGQDESRRGFGGYWEFVQKSEKNRAVMRRRIRRWLAENSGNLEWSSARSHPAGGWFELAQK